MRTLGKTLKGINVSGKLVDAEVIKFEMDKKARKISLVLSLDEVSPLSELDVLKKDMNEFYKLSESEISVFYANAAMDEAFFKSYYPNLLYETKKSVFRKKRNTDF